MLSISQAATFLGVSCPTLRRWERQTLLVPYRTAGNHRRYSREQLRAFLHGESGGNQSPSFGITYLYARVSSYKQKLAGNLQRQIDRLISAHAQLYGPETPYQIIQDYGSGLNAHRRGLQRLMRDAKRGKVARILITFPDRLTRFGYVFLQHFFATYHIPIVSVDDPPAKNLQEQLVIDMMALLASFSGKMYAIRTHAAKRRAKKSK